MVGIICEVTSADISENKARRELEAKGPDLKLGADYILVEKIKKLLEKKYSPDAIIMHFEKYGWPTDTRISTKTLYRYIYEGLLGDPGGCLLRGKRSRKKGTGGHRKHSRAKSALKSISTRPESIAERKDFGHWEIDSVVGGKRKGKHALLTLVERYTRYVLIRKLPDGSSKSIVKELCKLEKSLGSKKFREAFKTITCDNGSEFMDFEGMEHSCLTKSNRTRIYYARPYSSWERGSNENANGIIRRFIPKGSDIGYYSKTKIMEIQDWINNYPRRKLGGKSAQEAVGTKVAA